jgi:hypothetical protein
LRKAIQKCSRFAMLSRSLLFLLFALPAFASSALFVPTERSSVSTFEDLRHLIETEKLTTIEQVLGQLPAELRSNYVLMHESRSLQGSTPEEPRAILFGKDASLLVSFNGNPMHPGSDSLEVIQFRAATRSFEFRHIAFPDLANGKTKVEFSEPNPHRCLGCHGQSSPRPIWDSYPVWPGAYGGRREETPQVEAAFSAFKKAVPTHPRYRYLLGLGELFLKGANTDFNVRVAGWNYQRILGLMKQSPLFENYRWAAAAALMGCRISEGFLPTRVWEMHEKRVGPLADLERKTREAIIGSRSSYDSFFDMFDGRLEAIAALRFLFEPIGVDSSNW